MHAIFTPLHWPLTQKMCQQCRHIFWVGTSLFSTPPHRPNKAPHQSSVVIQSPGRLIWNWRVNLHFLHDANHLMRNISTTCWQVPCFYGQLTSSFASFVCCSHNINNMILKNIVVGSLQPACLPASPFANRLHPILPSHPALPSSHPILPTHFIPSDPSPSIPSRCGCSYPCLSLPLSLLL